MAEEAARRGVDAIAAAAKIDLVQIEFEQLVLREFPFEREREHHLAPLARPGVAVRQEDVARELLGDRRGALHAPPGAMGAHREHRRAGHPDRVEAGVIAKAAVLDRDHRILHHLWHLAQRQPAPVVRPEREEDGAVGGVDAHRLAGGRFLERLEAGHPLHREPDRDRQRDRADEGERQPQRTARRSHSRQRGTAAAPERGVLPEDEDFPDEAGCRSRRKVRVPSLAAPCQSQPVDVGPLDARDVVSPRRSPPHPVRARRSQAPRC